MCKNTQNYSIVNTSCNCQHFSSVWNEHIAKDKTEKTLKSNFILLDMLYVELATSMKALNTNFIEDLFLVWKFPKFNWMNYKVKVVNITISMIFPSYKKETNKIVIRRIVKLQNYICFLLRLCLYSLNIYTTLIHTLQTIF